MKRFLFEINRGEMAARDIFLMFIISKLYIQKNIVRRRVTTLDCKKFRLMMITELSIRYFLYQGMSGLREVIMFFTGIER